MSYDSVLKPGLFEQKIVVVTGGGSGIGRCCAHELASLGAYVILMGRTQSKLDTVQAEIESDGGQACGYSVDIRDEARVTEVIQLVIAEHGRIDALVNNAGGQYPSPLEAISKKGFETVVSNNLVGGFLMARETLRQWMKAHGGAIVNISADCENGFPGMGHTGAARAGMENLTKTAAWEWGVHGVRVNTVAPGMVATSGLDTYPEEFQKKLRHIHHAVPLNRLATESEVSATICFLLSPGAAFINGAVVHVNGGAQFGSSQSYWPLPRQDSSSQEQAYNGFHRSTLPRALSED